VGLFSRYSRGPIKVFQEHTDEPRNPELLAVTIFNRLSILTVTHIITFPQNQHVFISNGARFTSLAVRHPTIELISEGRLFMNLTRYIAILMLAFTFPAIAKAQQIAATSDTAVEVTPALNIEKRSDTSKSDDSLDKSASTLVKSNEKQVASESSDRHDRVNTAGLFANVHNPFENAPSKDESTAADPAPQTGASDGWQFRFTPYLWIAGISGNAGIGNLSVNVDSGITDTNVHLSFGFMGTLEARKDRFIIVTDLQYSNFGTDHPTPGPLFTSATANFKTFILDPEVGYRIAENTDKGTSVDVVGGFRYWHLEPDLTFTAGALPTVTASRSRGWVDAVGGIRGRARLSKRFFVIGKADLGGGGSKFTYQLFGGVGLLMGKRFALIGGYRDLSVDYNKDNFLFDVKLHGPILGLSIRF
jgi:hypothetical protein